MAAPVSSTLHIKLPREESFDFLLNGKIYDARAVMLDLLLTPGHVIDSDHVVMPNKIAEMNEEIASTDVQRLCERFSVDFSYFQSIWQVAFKQHAEPECIIFSTIEPVARCSRLDLVLGMDCDDELKSYLNKFNALFFS
jgi:hypothetical protein